VTSPSPAPRRAGAVQAARGAAGESGGKGGAEGERPQACGEGRAARGGRGEAALVAGGDEEGGRRAGEHERIADAPGPVLVHCGKGHGRSALVLAAIVVARGLAEGAAEAADYVRRRRRGVWLRPAQRAALARYVRASRRAGGSHGRGA
jgi:hypothetical protein